MSTFEREEYKWRETYFVLFDSCQRPSLKKVESVLMDLSDRFVLSNARADEDGRFESITVMSPDDYAAVDISYEAGEEVKEQGEAFYQEFKSGVVDAEERAKLCGFPSAMPASICCTSRKPAAKSRKTKSTRSSTPAPLIVLDALVELAEGVGVDPQSGTLL